MSIVIIVAFSYIPTDSNGALNILLTCSYYHSYSEYIFYDDGCHIKNLGTKMLYYIFTGILQVYRHRNNYVNKYFHICRNNWPHEQSTLYTLPVVSQ